MSSPGQFALLAQRRFAPLFWTQFLGAANDNVFKYAFTLLVTYEAADYTTLAPALAVKLIAALFVLPLLLLSATSGQLADQYDKARLMRLVKLLEVAIMLAGSRGFLGAPLRGAARLHLPDGAAFDAVRTGQVRIPDASAGAERNRRRQRVG